MEIFTVFFLSILNGLFAMSEIAILSASKTKLEYLVKSGNPRAKLALNLANNPENFLSTIQVGITLIGILAGALTGASLSEKLARFISTFPLISHYAGIISVTLVVVFITFISVVIGEIVPKRIAIAYPEPIALTAAKPLALISRTFSFVITVLNFFSKIVLRLLFIRTDNTSLVTEEEIKMLIERGRVDGAIDEAEQDLFNRVFHLSDRSMHSMMTPRMDIVWIDINTPTEESFKDMTLSSFNFFPICDGAIDKLLGIVSLRRAWMQKIKNGKIDFMEILEQPLLVPESVTLLRLLEGVKSSGAKVIVVVDEYGGIDGMITASDILEAVVGEFPSISSEDTPSITKRPDGSWLMDASLSVEELKDIMKLENLPREEDGDYQTLGGFVMSYLGHVPVVGESFSFKAHQFEVVDMDGPRLDKVLVSRMDA